MTSRPVSAPSAFNWRPMLTLLLQILAAVAFIVLLPVIFRMEWSNFTPLLTASSLRFLAIGLVATVVASLAAIILSLPLATLLALGRLSPYKWISWPSIAVIEVVRSLPLLLLIFYINIRFSNQLKVLEGVRFGDPSLFWGALVTTIFSQAGLATVVALTMYTAAVNAELLRSGILSLERGQNEAARSLGMTYWQSMGRIVLPQAYRRTLAPLVAQFTILVKDTSLGAIIGFIELLRRGQILFQRDFNPMESLYVVALIYFVINFLLGLSSKLIERRVPSVQLNPADM